MKSVEEWLASLRVPHPDSPTVTADSPTVTADSPTVTADSPTDGQATAPHPDSPKRKLKAPFSYFAVVQ